MASISKPAKPAPTPSPENLNPMLVNTVVENFIGPEYLYAWQTNRPRRPRRSLLRQASLGLPMGCDVCYTNHAEADQNDMDALLTLLGAAECELHHGRSRLGRHHAQLSEHFSFHDALYLRALLGLRPAPEFG